jgi:hypothetical protein
MHRLGSIELQRGSRSREGEAWSERHSSGVSKIMSRNQSLEKITSIDALRRIAERRVPRDFFEYGDHGSYSQSTLRANRSDLEAIKLRQRVAIDVDKRDLTTTILGEPSSLPLELAPIGLLGMQRGDGEILACRAAQEFHSVLAPCRSVRSRMSQPPSMPRSGFSCM